MLRQAAAAIALWAIWALLSFAQIVKYLHLRAGVTVSIVFPLLAVIILSKLPANSEPRARPILTRVLAAAWLLGAIAFFVLHAVSQSHSLGPGSDRENALEIACRALLAGNFPYGQLTFLQHPITPMPGALILASPFYLAHHIGLQNLFWLAVFIGSCYRLMSPSWATAWFVYVFVLCNPCIMQDFVTGGDFFTNFAYVVVFLSLVIRSLAAERPAWEAWVWPLLLGVALSSRPIYSLLYPCLLAFGIQTRGKSIAFRTAGLTLLSQLSVTLAVYLRDPAHFTPLRVGSNAYSLLPAWLHPAPFTFAVGLAIASVSFLVRMNVQRLWLILGSALTVVTLPLFVLDRVVRPELFPLINLIYLSPGLLLLAMWLVPFAARGSRESEQAL